MNKFAKFAFLLLLCSFTVIAFLTAQKVREPARGQENNTNLKFLLEYLDTRMREGEGFLITFQFMIPLVEEQDAWTIGSPTDQSRRHISAIGDDYVCLTESSGAATLTRCIPFSNVVSISYLED
jgi:hypothetical protein